MGLIKIPGGGAPASGDITITSAGTHDVKKYATATVGSGTQGTPTASKSISGNTATITPSCTDTSGWIDGSTKSGTAVTVTASEVCNSGSLTETANGTYTCTGYSSFVVAIPTYTGTIS